MPLRVGFIQAALHWEDAAANRSHFAEALSAFVGKTDLVILPEMFSTGFSMEAARLAEPINGPTVTWMHQQADRLQAALCGSLIIEEQGRFFNRLVWMSPDGNYQTYDKRHLFTYAQEDHHYTAGTDRLVVEWRGWRILPLICYDLRFPVWSRNTIDYDLLIYIANFPARRRLAWKTLLQARAIENLCYTIGVNRVGTDGNEIHYSGDSGLIDYGGNWRTYFSETAAAPILDLDYAAQQQFRARFGFLADRDTFEISGSSARTTP